MSGWTFALAVFGYVLVGIGTSRAVLTHQARKDPLFELSGPDYVIPAVAGGLVWPVVVPVWTVVSIVGPTFGRWFLAPALKAREEARR